MHFFFLFFLRRYNFREVLAFSTNSFHLGRFLMQSLQFVIFIFVMSLFTSSFHLFLGLPSDLLTDARRHKIIEMLKTLKTVTFTPTCFGSRKNHHQGAILCLTKTANVVSSLCYSLQTLPMLWRHVGLLCMRVVHGRGTN